VELPLTLFFKGKNNALQRIWKDDERARAALAKHGLNFQAREFDPHNSVFFVNFANVNFANLQVTKKHCSTMVPRDVCR